MNLIDFQVGSTIKKYRKRAGLTQAELGLYLSVTGATISDLERGKNKLTLDALMKIARPLGLEFLVEVYTRVYQYGYLNVGV